MPKLKPRSNFGRWHDEQEAPKFEALLRVPPFEPDSIIIVDMPTVPPTDLERRTQAMSELERDAFEHRCAWSAWCALGFEERMKIRERVAEEMGR